MVQGKPLMDYQPPPPLSLSMKMKIVKPKKILSNPREKWTPPERDLDDLDDDKLYKPTPLPEPPPTLNEWHPSKVIGVETANNTPEDGIQLEEWADLPEIGENEGDDQSIDSLIQVMEYGKSISYNNRSVKIVVL